VGNRCAFIITDHHGLVFEHGTLHLHALWRFIFGVYLHFYGVWLGVCWSRLWTLGLFYCFWFLEKEGYDTIPPRCQAVNMDRGYEVLFGVYRAFDFALSVFLGMLSFRYCIFLELESLHEEMGIRMGWGWSR
jgi:hypothetical protein